MGPLREPARMRPVDQLTIGYLGIGLVLLVAFSQRLDHAGWLALAHLLGICALIWGRRVPGTSRPRGLFLDLYPLVLFGLLYSEVAILNRSLFPDHFLDERIMALEQWLFRAQPSQDLHRWLPWRSLGEYLHLGYFLYYFLVPALLLTLYLRHEYERFEECIATLALAYYAGFALFIFLPVAGPYHHLPPTAADDYGYWMPRVVRWILDRGSSPGTAFPSSHVSVATTTWILAARHQRPLAVAFIFVVPALAVGAIYGGYHYATDILAGALLGVLISTLGRRWILHLVRQSRA